MVENALNDPKVKQAQAEEIDRVTRQTFDCFMIITVAYLHDRLGFGKKRLLEFIEYAVEQIHFAEELPDYFETMNEAIRDETGVDVLKNEVAKKGRKK